MIQGLAPKYDWRPNSSGSRRTIEEALVIARDNGVNIPDYVHFSIDTLKLIPAGCYAKTTTFKEPEGTMIYWSCLFHKKTHKIPFLIHEDVLTSDEAIVAVIGHEMYELEKLHEMFSEGAPIDHWLNETSGDNPENCHSDAWDYADELVARMRRKL